MRTLTLELPDEVYEVVERTAQADSQPPSAWVAARVPMLLPARKPRPVLTPDERAAAMARLSRHIGYADTGDPASANNERIEADLAREYANNHQ